MMETMMLGCIIIGVVIIVVALILMGKMGSSSSKNNFYSQSIKMAKNMLDENEDILRGISTKSANISSEGIEIKARAIKKGFSGDVIFCKHCGTEIDSDSKFCKNCGKEQ